MSGKDRPTGRRAGRLGKDTWIEQTVDGGQLCLVNARLECQSSGSAPLQHELSDFSLSVGTGDDCDWVLTDPLMSRRHFEIQRQAKGFRLRDLGSSNGTFFHGARVNDIVLTADDRFEAGRTTFTLRRLDDQKTLPLTEASSFGPLIGKSAGMRQVFAWLERLGKIDSNVFLQGETGTGKDLIAETLHHHSRRKDGPFVVVDCGALQSALVASELFGHVKGAFTGADQDRPGAFAAADGGTLFLDEIGELPIDLQPQLLRVLEKGEVKRLGETAYRKVDVRVVSATHRDLMTRVEQGKFRQDLFYRLSVMQIQVPPLRCRPEDIEDLAKAFMRRLHPDADVDALIGPDTLKVLESHDWPGNVRELRNVVERLLVFPERPELALGRIPAAGPASPAPAAFEYDGLPFYEAKRQWEAKLEKLYLTELMKAAQGTVSHAAKRAGVSRQTLYRLLSKHGIDPS